MRNYKALLSYFVICSDTGVGRKTRIISNIKIYQIIDSHMFEGHFKKKIKKRNKQNKQVQKKHRQIKNGSYFKVVFWSKRKGVLCITWTVRSKKTYCYHLNIYTMNFLAKGKLHCQKNVSNRISSVEDLAYSCFIFPKDILLNI